MFHPRSLAVYFVPLLSLMTSFDAVARGERDTLLVRLVYLVSRLQILLGKLLAHLVILVLAVTLGHAPWTGGDEEGGAPMR